MRKAVVFGWQRGGFSLVEVNIALLVIGVGMVALLGLFPVGLRQGNLATSDTAQAMFADQVLNMFHASAGTITNWPDWRSSTDFKRKLLDGATVPTLSGNHQLKFDDPEAKIEDYLVEDNHLKYWIRVMEVGEPVNYEGRVKRVWLQITDRLQGTTANSPVYCQDYVFQGETW